MDECSRLWAAASSWCQRLFGGTVKSWNSEVADYGGASSFWFCPSAWEEVQTPVCLVSVAQRGEKSIKKSQGEHLTAATDGKPRTTLSNTNLQEAAGPVHREKSASFTRQLDSAVWLAPGCVCVCVTCIRVCGSFQLAWMYLSMCCAEDGSGRRVKNSNCG